MKNARRAVLVANPSADLYGSDRMLLEGVRGLISAGEEVVVTCSTPGPLVARLEALGAEVRLQQVPIIRKAMLHPVGMIKMVRRIATQLPQMYRLLKQVRPDVVLVNTLTIPFWTLVTRLRRTPVLVYVHEAEAALPGVMRLLLRAPLAFASGVIYNSRTSQKVSKAPAKERRGRTWVVLNGVDGPPSPSPARPHLGESLHVCYVGRLSPRKGVDLVIDAMALLQTSGIEVRATIVGDVFAGYEWYRARLEERIDSLGLNEQVALVGFRAPVWDEVAAADVVIVPSRADESFGNVVIESLLSARPVLVADHSGLREAATGYASVLRVPPDNAEAFAEGIRTIHSEWDSYRAAALRDMERAAQLHDPARFHSQFTRVLAEFSP